MRSHGIFRVWVDSLVQFAIITLDQTWTWRDVAQNCDNKWCEFCNAYLWTLLLWKAEWCYQILSHLWNPPMPSTVLLLVCPVSPQALQALRSPSHRPQFVHSCVPSVYSHNFAIWGDRTLKEVFLVEVATRTFMLAAFVRWRVIIVYVPQHCRKHRNSRRNSTEVIDRILGPSCCFPLLLLPRFGISWLTNRCWWLELLC